MLPLNKTERRLRCYGLFWHRTSGRIGVVRILGTGPHWHRKSCSNSHAPVVAGRSGWTMARFFVGGPSSRRTVRSHSDRTSPPR
jgi:hypothetical protein